MNVGIEPASGQDPALSRDRLGRRSDDDSDAGLRIRIPGLADTGDASVPDPHVGLDDPAAVHDQRIGDDRIGGAPAARDLALAHAVADHLAAAELHLLAIGREIALDLDDEIGVGKPDPVAGRRAVHGRIGGARDIRRHQSSPPMTFRLNP